MRWRERTGPEPDKGLLAAAGGNRFLAAMFARRGLLGRDAIAHFIDPARYQPSPADLLPGMSAGVDEIESAINDGQRIAVWGDFDVDGQTATTVLVDGLRGLGADVIYHIPERAAESHGLNLPKLAELIRDRARLLVTCDTGISAHAEIEYARKKGLRVVITDHHDLPEILPEAEAVINPKLLADHPLCCLPGVGVAYKLIEALYLRAGRVGDSDKYLDLVALGIVADVAEVTGDCRYLLQRGLEVLQRGERLALRVMCEYAGLLPELITEDDIGFQIGPRLNSLGRLGNARGVVDFLTTTNLETAKVVALQLEGANNQRRFLTEQTLQSAVRMIEQDREYRTEPALVLFNEHWHPGVVGIVASKLVERFHMPAVLLTDRGEGIARGSARSVAGCDIHKAVAACADTLLGFGGHTMAAGMSLEMANLAKFKARLLQAVSDQLGDTAGEPELEIEMMVSLADVTGGLVEAVTLLAPFGPGNPKPIFGCRDVRLVSSRALGRDGSHRRLIVEDGGEVHHPVLWWDGGEWDLPQGEFNLAFTITVGQFRGKQQVQLVLEDYLADVSAAEEVERFKIVDLRQADDPFEALKALIEAEPEMQIWMEGDRSAGIAGRDRHRLMPSRTLAIWTAPPSYWVLQHAIHTVGPEKVMLFWVEPETGDVSVFLQNLAGMLKYAINQKQAEIELDTMAAGLAQTKAAVRLGIAWLETKDVVEVRREESDRLVVAGGKASGNNTPGLAAIQRDLRLVLKENAAFRASVRGQEIDSLREELGQMTA